MKQFLWEMLSKPFLEPKEHKEIEVSSEVAMKDVDMSLEDNIPIGFFDNGNYMLGEKHKVHSEQKNLIETYRRISNNAEVSDAISEIIDEAVFSPNDKDILSIVFNDDVPQALKDKLSEELSEIMRKLNLKKNIYNMFMQFYIDGQLNVHCQYNEGDLSSGIVKLSVISPLGLYFNKTKNRWEYIEEDYNQFGQKRAEINKYFSKEEIIHIDSGLYKGNLILSNLHKSIKPANMLSTLEDMLIPMRFSRSVSRRIFNVDVSNINNKKAEEIMKKYQNKFKYKKFYDLETGTISNQQHVTALTEDYWFPNRGGEKGTTVDTIDETGNLGELSDILYFKRKLYKTLRVPVNRISDEGDSGAEFTYDSTSVTREEIKFFNFISLQRNLFLDLFYELLKREAIAKGYINLEEWEELHKKFKIKFVSENKFYEKMERDIFADALSLYSEVEDKIGKYFSYEFVNKKIFKLSDEEIKTMAEQIEKEKKDPLYKRFYEKDEEDY